MSKYKVIFHQGDYNDDNEDLKEICTSQTIEEAAERGYNYITSKGYSYSCETKESIIESLISRQFYMIGYGPNSIEIIEND